MTKASIEHIQTMLRTIGQYQNKPSPISVDGIWNEFTIDAVKEFQREYGLPVTGQADFETIEAIENAFIISKNFVNESLAIHPFPECDTQFKKGDYSPVIIIVQVMLNAIAVKYSNFDSVNTNGRFEEDTEDAIKKIQLQSGLLSNGIIDKITWNAIALIYNSFSKRC